MNENTKNKKDKAAKKDYYTPVTVCQIITAAVLFGLYFFIINPSQSLKAELLSYLNEEKWSTYGIVDSVKEYFLSGGTWQVSGSNVKYEAEKEISSLPSGAGGEDIEIYKAAENTSFAPVRATVPAVMPVENGRYTSYFGYRINPITGQFSFHTGLDIAALEGTPVCAAYSGSVTKVGEDSRAGKYIIITHDEGFVTFYCHCSEILAEDGDNIKQGEVIALVGTTGWSTGPHLHFEVRKNNIRCNPLFVLGNDS